MPVVQGISMPNIDSIPLKARELQGLLWLKSAVKTIESNWVKRSQLGPGPFWLGVKLGQGVKMGRNIFTEFFVVINVGI